MKNDSGNMKKEPLRCGIGYEHAIGLTLACVHFPKATGRYFSPDRIHRHTAR